ncbi:MAG TPA: hypothetical protein VF510_03395 [Ktedonobacterales bacterium]
MSKRTAFSRKSEQRHWHIRHEQEEAKRQMKRAQKFERKTGSDQYPNVRAAQDTTREEERPGRESGAPRDLY